MLSTIGPGHNEIYSEIPVFGNTTAIDVGFQAEQVNTNTRQSTPGQSLISFIYREAPNSEPFTITKVSVYTCRAPEIDKNTANLCQGSKNGMVFECSTFKESDGGLAKTQAAIAEPKLMEGDVDAEGQEDYFLYGNNSQQIVIDVPFTIEPTMLTFMAKNFSRSKLLMVISVKGSNAGVICQVNGKTQKPSGKEVTEVDVHGLEIELEMPPNLVTF